jgi:hypothetical protein
MTVSSAFSFASVSIAFFSPLLGRAFSSFSFLYKSIQSFTHYFAELLLITEWSDFEWREVKPQIVRKLLDQQHSVIFNFYSILIS